MIINFEKRFQIVFRKHNELIDKYYVSLKKLLQQEPEFYGDFVYEFKRILGKSDFSNQSKKIIKFTSEEDIIWTLCDRQHA